MNFSVVVGPRGNQHKSESGGSCRILQGSLERVGRCVASRLPLQTRRPPCVL
uniref:RepX n=1 Tax=Sinorhizobium fredii (strain NBRC 101917 / NGR234) TaxID=394 RepID=A0A1Q2XE09_SINFN|nr:TPA_exp: RepX [Sinorhizobium fredii NGR234]